MRLLDLFSGIGGFSLGLERAGFQTIAFCEQDKFCQAVLRKHWPHIPIYEDVRTLTAQQLAEDGIEAIDAICGGFPCQDISFAGKGAGLAGARSGLWREFRRLIGEIRPKRVYIENVSALLNRGLLAVLGDLASLGYDAEWRTVSASRYGFPQNRERTWIAAYPDGEGGEGLVTCGYPRTMRPRGWSGKKDLLTLAERPFCESDLWPQPLICRVDERLPNRVHRIKSLGNTVIPDMVSA